LLRLFNLEKNLNSLIDENPYKQSYFAPNSDLQVLPIKKIKRNEKKIIFILAWRYKKKILSKLKKFDNKNSTIVVLKPCMRKVTIC